ncbi:MULTISPECIES: helix-turn-helix domain-containing protein [Streptomycetaceae]|uniref:HTH cro/C1-type domain-containing protein n=1 Tax=Streptantibioticus cattleyicolor (strain ATCC 35852 / DSM 46488 / JCM 4925 / NBRC 14057 / NRRL 8057) TaxID=1003195 RepID=F8JSL4_STREN|nr:MULTISPECIES: helix-turn-helix transcriptional regulator [Streptomycetaceae]AEW96744.1 hypothetical protein SCATT_43730 [Streptantibioticus cattleyicolor NRRL 8057 = DSM 46488]MYS61229.1 helix-turn-helix domain-containing protein [Streptomyces sp. SID5468]CCB77078.1 DNA-binding protein [Streptantibioticus cattleyicolor NRRL 8057 = DSM 46488]
MKIPDQNDGPAFEEDSVNELLRSFGRQMKILREAAGLTQAELGKKLGYSESAVSAVERGARIPRPEMIESVDKVLRARGLLLTRKREIGYAHYPAFFRDAARIEEEAVEFHQYAPLIVPGMLQTEDYSRAIFRMWRPRRHDAEIEQLVAARMARHALFDRKPAPTLSFVLEESVLQRRLGGVEVLRGQLEHLLLVCDDPNVEIQVMPTRVSDHACVDGPFTLMTAQGQEQVGYLESQGYGRVIHDQETVRELAVRYGILRAQAMPPLESMQFIEKLLQGVL